MSTDFELCQKVVEACLALAGRGFLAGTGGNVSRRLDSSRLAITPSGCDYYTLAANDICIVDLNSLKVLAGQRKPSVETALHAAMLRYRSDARAVVHTHQPLASAVALLGVDIPVQDAEARQLLGTRIVAVPYAPSGTPLLVRALRKTLRKDVNAYLLRNHGFICCARTLAEAIAMTEEVEREAHRYLRRAVERASGSEVARELLEELP